MDARDIDRKIDQAAEAAKRAVAAVDDTRQVAGELADALIENAREQIRLAAASGENRLTDYLTRTTYRLEQTVKSLADTLDEWARKAAVRSEAAAAARSSRRASRWLDQE